MKAHFKFLPGEQKRFLLEVAKKSGLKNDQLANFVGISPRNYTDWLREKLCISESSATLFSKRFMVRLPEKRNKLISRWKKSKSLAGTKGGRAFHKKYGSPATTEGRIKGGLKVLKISRARGLISEAKLFSSPEDLSTDLTEFVGIVLGDGGLTNSELGITLNSIADKNYIGYVFNLILKIFNEKPRVYKVKNCNAVTLKVYGVNFASYLKSIGLIPGNKVRQQVGIPKWINTKPQYRLACVRGLLDTDGCVFIHKYQVNGKQYSYKKIGFSNQSIPLINFVNSVLSVLGMNPKITNYGGIYRLWLYNENEVQTYFNLVGSSNQRLLKFKK